MSGPAEPGAGLASSETQEAPQGQGGTRAPRGQPNDGLARARAVLVYLASQLVDDSEAVRVDTTETRSGARLTLQVAPGEAGRVIGRRGRVAQAIRAVVRAAGARTGWTFPSTSPTNASVAELLEVGRVVRPHGLKGQVVVELWTNRRERVLPGAALQGPTGVLRVVRSSPLAPSGGRERWLVAFEGVEDRTSAENLRGALLRASEIIEPDALWVHRLIGREVFDRSGARLGIVLAVEANPASDLLVLDGGSLVPLTFLVEHSEERLIVDPPEGLLEV